MFFPVRLHDAVDSDTVLRRLLPVLAGPRGERRVAYASFDAARGVFAKRWTLGEGGAVEEAAVELEPQRIHSLLLDDAGGDRPLRPCESAPVWVLRDLLPGIEPERNTIRVRAIAHDGALLGALVVAEPRRFSLGKKDEGSVAAAGDVLEMALARAMALDAAGPVLPLGQPVGLTESVVERLKESERAVAEARGEMERTRARIEALERAAGGATELLMDAHVELDRRTAKHQRQTRVLFLLRKLLDRSAQGDLEPTELAVEIVRTVAEAFGGGRCSLLLIDESSPDRELRLGAAVGLPPALDAGEVRVPLGSGISGEVARTRTPVVVRDPAEDSSGGALVGDDWYTSDAFVSLPLVSRGRLMGVLNLTNFRAGTVDDAEVEQLRLVSLCVALLADHAGLSERLFAARAS